MTDRKRLIELIADTQQDFQKWCLECEKDKNKDHQPFEEYLADKLLANGVIVSPLKLGDKIYQIFGNKIVKFEVLDIEIEFRNFVRKKYRYNYNAFTNDDFGKTVFLTKEEAEAKLKECDT